MIMIPTTKKSPVVITQGYHNDHKALDLANGTDQVFAIGDSDIITIGKTVSGADYIFTYCKELNIYISYVHVANMLKGIKYARKGAVLGVTNDSGSTTAPHLHLACFDDINATRRINFQYYLNKYFVEWRYSQMEKTVLSKSEDKYGA